MYGMLYIRDKPKASVGAMQPLPSQFDETENPVAKPFVKWVGGKRSLLDELMARAPSDFNNYYEPFLGGGALFFTLTKYYKKGANKLCLSDINRDLITAYQVIQRDADPLIDKLREHAQKHSRAYYYDTRKQHHLQDPIEKAARFIYLNKTCFNGLWRVNSKGEFNVPISSAKNPGIYQEDNLRACHIALQGVDIQCQDFRETAAGKDDFVYFDPPYHPLNATSSFTSYAKNGFTPQDQTALRDLCLALHQQGTKVMLSNSDTAFIRQLYQSAVFNTATVQAPRMINSDADKRGAVNELLITNY